MSLARKAVVSLTTGMEDAERVTVAFATRWGRRRRCRRSRRRWPSGA